MFENTLNRAKFIYADTDSIKVEVLPMKEIINACIKVQCVYSDIPVQDRIYITFGRIVTEKECHDDDLLRIINTIKSEFEFLEGVWNGKEKRES